MANWSRVTKPGGTTAWNDGDTLLSVDLNGDIDAGLQQVNGNLSNVNLAAGAGIEQSKIDGYSDSATEMATETNPGHTGSPSAASTLQGEVERLRYKIKELGLGSSVKRLDGTAGVDLISWFDTPVAGPNLARNSMMCVKTSATATVAPDGWTAVGPATSYTLGYLGTSEATNNVAIVCRASNADGMSQTFAGLKPSTKYLVSARLFTSAGTARLVTTGSDSAFAGVYDDLDIPYTAAVWSTVSGVIITDATPTDIVVSILGSSDATVDTFGVTKVEVRQCATDSSPMSDTPWAYQQITTATGDRYASGTLTDSEMPAAVVRCPGPGYVIEVVGAMQVGDASVGVLSFAGELRENGTGVQVSKVNLTSGTGTIRTGTAWFNYVLRDPVPGTAYSYTMFGAGIGAAVDRNPAASAAGETPIVTWCRVRAVLESGGH